MATLIVENATWAKQSTLSAKFLQNNAKVLLQPGKYEVENIDVHARERQYLVVRFPKKMLAADGKTSFQAWVVFDDDVLTPWEQTVEPKYLLKVPFFAQMATAAEPTIKSLRDQRRSCNTSGCAMAAKAMGARIMGDDDYFGVVSKYGDSTDHGAQTAALEELGIESEWRTDLDFADLDMALAAGTPIVIGILHHGPINAPRGDGHMIVVIGKIEGASPKDDIYIVNDPFGELPYTGPVELGKHVHYSRYMLERRWTVEGAGTGWGRIFKAKAQN